MSSRPRARTLLLLLIAGAAVVATLFISPIPQDPAYHHFADQRMILGIPNFWNVVSNLPFLLVGLLGLQAIRTGELPGGLHALRPVCWTFFIGVSFVAFGSGYYHWAPSNTTLIWDRLPMTVSFMAFCSAIVGEYIDTAAGRRLLLPLLAVGLGSAIYWYLGELHGNGDLRPYALVQFLPMLLIPLILILYPPRLVPTGYLWGVVVAYGAAKLAELGDGQILHVLGAFSGHSIKHLLGAFGAYGFLLALQRRRPADSGIDMIPDTEPILK